MSTNWANVTVALTPYFASQHHTYFITVCVVNYCVQVNRTVKAALEIHCVSGFTGNWLILRTYLGSLKEF